MSGCWNSLGPDSSARWRFYSAHCRVLATWENASDPLSARCPISATKRTTISGRKTRPRPEVGPYASIAYFQRYFSLQSTCTLKTSEFSSYTESVTNEEVRAKIQQAIGPHEDLLTIGKRRKRQWYDHVSRSSCLAKTILQGTAKEGRRQGRQRKR